jgi:hypothetical protein
MRSTRKSRDPEPTKRQGPEAVALHDNPKPNANRRKGARNDPEKDQRIFAFSLQ